MKKNLIFLGILLIISQLTGFAQNPKLKTGLWRVAIQLQGGEAPFHLDIKSENNRYVAYILNAEERLKLDEISVKNDSVIMHLHIFDAVLAAKLENENKMVGQWIKYAYKSSQAVAFVAEYGQKPRFVESEQAPALNVEGKWSITFTDQNQKSYPAVGIFKQKGKKIVGTFLTTTGDYRYLEGILEGSQMRLSTFDGNHGFLFKTQGDAKQLQGEFWAGKLGYETFSGFKNDTASLPDADKLTFLKEGYERLAFSFPNLKQKKVSLTDSAYRGKVVIVQIMGSWCPNCMDETAFLASWYKKHKQRGAEVIGLAYERSPEFAQAKVGVEKMQARYKIDYEVLIAGTNNKQAAAETLPMLNQVLAFPTTIFIDRQGKVRRIHTGFTGPGTGIYYEKFKREFNQFMDKLLAENP
ncbi:MAG: TlpA family protein disulfide reductase [Microscillaceae bacterium]|jgi:thiol-disulfide isomerase/thioredoxin|nr:TlpA family protein disulfide reductase [Microscillaceae bacterium]